MFLAEKGIEVPLEEVDINQAENRKPPFLAKNPMGTLPVLELDDGTYLAESQAICHYFEDLHPEPPLIGATPQQRAIVQMWEWHFVEELEHRNVAFDVYDHVCGGYVYRLFISLYAQWHFTRWIRKVNRYMLKTCPPPQRNAEERRARRKVAWSLRKTLLRKLLPDVLRIYLPSYTPHAVKISPAMQAIADRYTEMAIRHS